MMSVARLGWLFGMLFAITLASTLPAFAQTDGTIAASYRCLDGLASGALYDSNPSCPTTLTFDNIFSYFICNMEQLSSNLMGSMYCGMVYSLTPAVIAVLTLAVLFFGMGFTIGVIPATAREFQKFLLKIAFVFVFATQAEYLIGFGYRFLVEGAREGIAVAMSGLYTGSDGSIDPRIAGPDGVVTGADVYIMMDKFLGRTIRFATDYVGSNWNDPNGAGNPCKNALFAVLAIMAIAFPPLFYLSLLIITKVALTFLRGVFGYVFAIVGIAFLLTLAPIFLSFYLFQQTRPYFDKWLGYLVSFALQMMVVFAFLSFVVTIDVRNLSNSIVDIIVPMRETQETTSFRFPWQYCTLCEFEVVEHQRDAEGNITSTTVLTEDQYEDFLGKGELRCKANPNYDANATDPANRVNYTPIRALTPYTPDEKSSDPNAAPDRSVQNTLLKFVGTALLSLLVLAYVVDGILRFIPYFAQKLAGGIAPYAPQLGGGHSPSGVTVADIPGVGKYEAGQGYTGVFGGFERGFNRGFTTGGGTTVNRTWAGMREGMSQMVGGRKDAAGNPITDANGNVVDPGLTDRFARWLTNPLSKDGN